MKHLKYSLIAIIVLVIAAFLVYGLSSNEPEDPGITTSPSSVKTKAMDHRIDSLIVNAPNSRFCIDAYNKCISDINQLFANEPTNKKTYKLKLNREYTDKFIAQANYVFDHNDWKKEDIRIIRAETSRLLNINSGKEGLKEINAVLADYDTLVKFNNKVAKLCVQEPKCKDDHSYFYREDDWNSSYARKLISSVPSVDSKAKNAPVYARTRQDKVKDRLHQGHKNYMKTKLDLSEDEAKSYNYDSARNTDYSKMKSLLNKCCDTYEGMWDKEVGDWRIRIANWEVYAPVANI